MSVARTAKSQSYQINRRDVLKSAALVGAVSVLGVSMAATGRARAVVPASVETLYLTDSGGDNGGSFLTKLCRVDLDSSTGRANLTLLHEVTDPDFDQVDAIAASLDGTTVYMVDKTSKHLGTYDVTGSTFTDHGTVSGLPGGVVLAAFSPSGTLFVASQDTNKLYTVDVAGPSATEYVTVTGADVQGADIAFDADEVLFLYSSGAKALYTVDYDSSSSTFGEATAVGSTGDFFTGLAVRDAGNGDLVGSNTTRDEIVVVDKTTGAQGTAFEMYLDGSRYAYGYGDMTVGALDVEVCLDCEFDGVHKFEYVYDEEMQVDGFVLEGTGFDDVSFVSYTSKEGEHHEPVSVVFETDICADMLVAHVKAGRAVHEVDVVDNGDGTVTVSIEGDERFVNPKIPCCTLKINSPDGTPWPGYGSSPTKGAQNGAEI